MSFGTGLRFIKSGIIPILLILIFGIGTAGLTAGSTQVKPNDEGLTDDLLGSFAPHVVYPDAVRIEDFSGTITANLTANGSYSFKKSYIEENDTTEKISFRINMAIIYTRNKKMEKVTARVSGNRKYFMYRRPVGKLYPPSRITEEEEITGTLTKTYPGSAVAPVYWSKGLKLFCFPANLGDQPNGWASHFVGIPVKIDTHRRHIDGNDVIADEKYSGEHMISAIIPAFGTSGSRWTRAVQAKNIKGWNLGMGGWVETASTHGNSNGSYSTQLYSPDGFNWVSEGSFRENGEEPKKKPEGPYDIIWNGTLQMTWSLGSAVPLAKMTIAPAEIKEYENWVPSPIDDDRFGQPKSLVFVAEIKAKEEGKPAPPGRIHFWLNDVSREKGQCTNYPLNGKDDPDLRFAPNQAHLIIDPNNPLHAYTKDFVTSASVEVEALDTGAYGKLQATCEDLGLIAEDERNGSQVISIPLDDNQNYVADAWERERGILKYDFPTTEDEDNKPAKQRRNGDGYTLYEEYRGFMTQKGFIRTNPLQKDLFVYDPDGIVKKWYEPYNSAQLTIHYIDLQMMKFNGQAQEPSNRWVNFNSSEGKWYARQYAMFVKAWTTMDQTIGEAKSRDDVDTVGDIDPYAAFKEPLKKIYIIKISEKGLEKRLAAINSTAVKQDVFSKMMASVVIHEMGHGLGISHHKETEMETDESVIEGVFDCAIRYTTPAEYGHPELLKEQTRYCREGETWKRAEDGKFIGYPSHDCFGQIDVKSDP